MDLLDIGGQGILENPHHHPDGLGRIVIPALNRR